MPPVVAAAAVAGIGAAGSLVVASATVLFSVTAAAITFGTTLVLGLVSQALAPKPPDFSAQMKGRTVTVRQPTAPREIVYGRVRKGGTFVFVFIHSTGKNNGSSISSSRSWATA